MAVIVNNKPNLEFSFLGGNLLVKDYLEEYDGLDLANYICVDYITYKGKIVNTNTNLKSKNALANFSLTK